jgi:hypothetical protein
MGREISLFADYHQRENSLTNHCGMLFRLIYRESPQQFEELILALLPEKGQLRVGPLFTQQEKRGKSVPDLLIQQEAFSLFFETKINDWFHDGQLTSHVQALTKSPGGKVLFCLSNFERDDPETQFSDLIREAERQSVHVQFVSFEELLQQIRARRLSNTLIETVDEFEQYLDRDGLLPRWRYLLDVVNCGKTMDEIRVGAYMCPNTGGPYSHVRARFLGSYQSKMVPSVHEIDALVACSAEGKEFELVWKNKDETDIALRDRGRAMIKKINIEAHSETLKNQGLQIFLLGEGAETQFTKDSSGGLLGSHLYFWDIARKLEAETASALAEKLNGRKWSEFGH